MAGTLPWQFVELRPPRDISALAQLRETAVAARFSHSEPAICIASIRELDAISNRKLRNPCPRQAQRQIDVRRRVCGALAGREPDSSGCKHAPILITLRPPFDHGRPRFDRAD